jgi:hypothetical protein
MYKNSDDKYINLRGGKRVTLLDIDDIKKLQTPIGKAIYNNSIGRPPKKEGEKALPNDRLNCEICGGKFIRSHRTAHKKTKVHKAYENMNRKISKVLLDINDE